LKENSIQFNPGIVFVVPVNQVARKKKNRPERHQDSLLKPRRRFSELSFRTSSGFIRSGTVASSSSVAGPFQVTPNA
jgi:hypothetical protein